MALEQLLKCVKVLVGQERGKTILPKRVNTIVSKKKSKKQWKHQMMILETVNNS